MREGQGLKDRQIFVRSEKEEKRERSVKGRERGGRGLDRQTDREL